MTLFAFAGKCVERGAIGRGSGAGADVACVLANSPANAPLPLVSSDASAIFPTPTPQVSKNCRRVRSRSSARLCARGLLQGMAGLLLRDRLVEVQDRPRHGG